MLGNTGDNHGTPAKRYASRLPANRSPFSQVRVGIQGKAPGNNRYGAKGVLMCVGCRQRKKPVSHVHNFADKSAIMTIPRRTVGFVNKGVYFAVRNSRNYNTAREAGEEPSRHMRRTRTSLSNTFAKVKKPLIRTSRRKSCWTPWPIAFPGRRRNCMQNDRSNKPSKTGVTPAAQMPPIHT